MPLILLNLKKKRNLWNFTEKKYIVTWKSCFLQNVFKRPKRLKMDTLYISEKESAYSVHFLVFNQNIEINRKWFKKVTFGVKSFFFRKRDDFP